MVYGIKKTLLFVALAISAVVCLADARSDSGGPKPSPTAALALWKSRDAQGIRFVGSSACVECHAAQAGEQSETPMARALEMPLDSGVLKANPKMTFRDGPFTHRIARDDDRVVYTVTNGAKSISEPVLYTFGQGVVGQSYLFRHEGKFYEARVSYFRKVKGLHFTIGHSTTVPASLEDALGRPVAEDEVVSCFGCHTPTAVNKSQLQLDRITPGIDCESCHGPGEKHVAAVRAKETTDATGSYIFNPGRLNANDLTQEFCGTCHLSFEQAMLLPGQGETNNVRFQAYRIFNSPGHRGADPRISCIACHDPHVKLEHDDAAYDAKCLACHLSSPKDAKTEERAAAACPVKPKDCVTCHMPEIEVPGMHAKFTDHWIRIVRPGDAIPH